MKKYIHTLIFFVYLFLSAVIFLWYVAPVRAEWTRQPITFTNDYTGWEETGKYQPTVLVKDGQFKMWFSSYNGSQAKIGYATSPDGLSWTSHGPVLASPELDLGDPTVIHEESGYRMWFSGNYPGQAGIRIYYATSTNGITWESTFIPVLVGSPGAWDSQSVAAPFVLKEANGTYRMWYSGYGSEWDVGLATSLDGVTWEKYPNQLLSIAGGSSVILDGSGYKLYYERYGQCGYGIYSVGSSDGMQWNGVDIPEQVACTQGSEDNFIFAPSAVKNNSQTYVYFTGVSTTGTGSIFFTSHSTSVPTQTPSPTPTPPTSPTATLGASTPTPTQERVPIVFIPGLFGSWNGDALLHKKVVEPFSWIENPVVKEYDGVKNTFSRLGYQRDTDFYIFAYDWRKPVEETADILDTYIREKALAGNENKKIILIGHSLGGIVARVYAQKYGTESISKILTVGSPHKGTTKVYETLLSGHIESENTYLWLSERMLVELYRKPGRSVRDTVRTELPVLYDLLPTYRFLQDKQKTFVSSASFGLKNDLLRNYQDMSSISNSLVMAGSKSIKTLSTYVIDKQGKPISSSSDLGDGAILARSAMVGAKQIELTGNHGEIIYTKNNIKKLLEALHITYQNDQIVEGQGTKITPSILILVRSPITVTVNYGGRTYTDNQGVVFIENAKRGDFTIHARGTGSGQYSLVIGKLFDGESEWKTIRGEITNPDPQLEEDTYTFTFNQKKKCFEVHGTKRKVRNFKRLF